MRIFKKITIGQGDDYTTACLLNFCFFKENHNLKHLMLIRKQCNKLILLEIQIEPETIFLIIDEAKETILDFSQGTVRVL